MDVEIGNLYAVHHGDYAGQMFALINKEEQGYNFLIMPSMENLFVSNEDFINGYKKEIIKLVEKAPEEVFEVIKAQYEKNENINY